MGWGVRRLGWGSCQFPDAGSQFWNLATGDWELPLDPPRYLVGYRAGPAAMPEGMPGTGIRTPVSLSFDPATR
jgi:hypothetical protein